MVGLWCLENNFNFRQTMNRFIKHFSAFTIALLAMVGCTNFEERGVGESQNSAISSKIINTSHNAVEGSLLIELSESGSVAFENASRSTDITRSNIEALNNQLLEIGTTSISRLFPINEALEARAREAGLHRWYVVKFDKEVSLDYAARALAQIDEIETVEFNTRIDLPAQRPVTPQNLTRRATRLATPEFDDPHADLQWDLHNTGEIIGNNGVQSVAGMDINVREAWKYTTGDSSIIVAVVDQGVDYTHEDLAANMWVNKGEIPGNGKDDDKNGYVDDIHGYNFVDDGPLTWDKYDESDPGNPGDVGHGTHVAGTIAAVNNNGVGICGIAGGDGSENSGVKIMSLQIYSGNNKYSGSSEVISKAFYYALAHGAVIANCSWGAVPNIGQDNDGLYTQSRSVQHKAMEAFCAKSNHPNIDKNLVICAAGNNTMEQSCYPGAYRKYISVTSFGMDGLPAYYSNYGPGCNISAPGGNLRHGEVGGILSTVTHGLYGRENNPIPGYAYEQGTSMACPHVTGVAALGLAYAKKLGKKLSCEEFKSMILTSVNDMDSMMEGTSYNKFIGKMGTGRIDAFRLLMNIEGITCIDVPRGVPYYEIDLSKYLSDGNVSLKLIENGVSISSKDMKRLGMNSKPNVLTFINKITVTCNNVGSAIISVKMVAGGEAAGSSTSVGGMEITKRFALIVRDNFASNGGWL